MDMLGTLMRTASDRPRVALAVLILALSAALGFTVSPTAIWWTSVPARVFMVALLGRVWWQLFIAREPLAPRSWLMIWCFAAVVCSCVAIHLWLGPELFGAERWAKMWSSLGAFQSTIIEDRGWLPLAFLMAVVGAVWYTCWDLGPGEDRNWEGKARRAPWLPY